MDEKKSTRLRRLTALCLGVVFLLAGAGAQQLLRCWQGRSSRGAGQKNTAPGREGRHFLEKTGKGP